MQRRLSDEDVRNIRAAHARGASQLSLARKYGTTTTTIHYIVHRVTYRDVPDLEPEAAA